MPTPRKVNGNSKGEGGLKAQFFEQKYDTKMEFPKGWVVQIKKKPSKAGVWIFSGTTHLDFSPNVFLVSIRLSTATNWGLLNELALKKLITILYDANNITEYSY